MTCVIGVAPGVRVAFGADTSIPTQPPVGLHLVGEVSVQPDGVLVDLGDGGRRIVPTYVSTGVDLSGWFLKPYGVLYLDKGGVTMEALNVPALLRHGRRAVGDVRGDGGLWLALDGDGVLLAAGDEWDFDTAHVDLWSFLDKGRQWFEPDDELFGVNYCHDGVWIGPDDHKADAADLPANLPEEIRLMFVEGIFGADHCT